MLVRAEHGFICGKGNIVRVIIEAGMLSGGEELGR